MRKIISVTIYPPGGDTVRHEVGKGGVSKIKLWNESRLSEGLRVVFESGSEKVYSRMPLSYDYGKATEKGLA